MTTIQYNELVKLYGQYATVVSEARGSFVATVNQILDVVRRQASALADAQVNEKRSSSWDGQYRYWSLDPLDKWARPYVWICATDPRIVFPGQLLLNVNAEKPSNETKNSVLSISKLPNIGPLQEPPEEKSIFSVSYESKDGQSIERIAERVAHLLRILRDDTK